MTAAELAKIDYSVRASDLFYLMCDWQERANAIRAMERERRAAGQESLAMAADLIATAIETTIEETRDLLVRAHPGDSNGN